MRAITLLLLILTLVVLPAPAVAQGDDPQAVVEAYVAAVNAHQLETAMAFYADDVAEKEAIRAAFRSDFARGSFTMDVVAYWVSGNHVTWDWRVNLYPYPQLAVPPLTGTTTVAVVDGRFQSIHGSLDPASAQRRQAAIQALAAIQAFAAKPAVATVLQPSAPNSQERAVPSIAPWAVAITLCILGGICIAALKSPTEGG